MGNVRSSITLKMEFQPSLSLGYLDLTQSNSPKFNLDEVLKYNPEFETVIKEHPWCVTVIEDFNGEVEEDVEDDSLMLIGTGNKPFFTIQSGL